MFCFKWILNRVLLSRNGKNAIFSLFMPSKFIVTIWLHQVRLQSSTYWLFELQKILLCHWFCQTAENICEELTFKTVYIMLWVRINRIPTYLWDRSFKLKTISSKWLSKIYKVCHLTKLCLKSSSSEIGGDKM